MLHLDTDTRSAAHYAASLRARDAELRRTDALSLAAARGAARSSGGGSRSAESRRFGGRGGGRRGGGGAPADLVGIEGWVASTNHYRTAANNPMLGDAGGVWVSMLLRVLAVPGAGILTLANSSTGAANGWSLITSTLGQLTFGAYNGAAAAVFAPNTGGYATVSGVVAGDIGKVIHVVGVLDVVGSLIRSYRAASEVGDGAAITGYTNATAAGRTAIGSLIGTTGSAAWASIVGFSGGTGLPDLAAITAHYAACKAELGMALMGGAGVTVTHRWQARANDPPAASWADDIGAVAQAKTGTLAASRFVPVWDRTPTRVVHLGDSITSNTAYHRTQVYVRSVATLKSRGPYSSGTYPGNLSAGVSGETLVQMEARVAADVTAYTPGLIIVHGGTNDASGGASGATMATRLATLLATLRAGNATAYIVVCKIPPRLGFETACTDFNALVAGVCAAQDARCIAIDPALVAGDLIDGVHPNAGGAIKLGDAIWDLGVNPILGAL